jgi:hypothetical protein
MRASSWVGLAAALGFVVTTQAPLSRGPLSAVLLGVVGLMTLVGFGLAARLRHDEATRVGGDDNIQVEQLTRDVRAHRLSRRMRGRPRRAWLGVAGRRDHAARAPHARRS